MMRSKKPEIFFFKQDVLLPLSQRNRLKEFLPRLFRSESTPLDSLNYIFCSDMYLLEINRRYLHHDFYTDIITFNLAEKKEPVQGEIYISMDRVRENARQFKTSIRQEIHRVIFHGALHLCGYKDKSTGDLKKMRDRENYWLKKYLA